MPPSPISIVRNLPHHLWSRLPLCSTKRSPIVRFAPSRLLSISSIRNQSPSTTSSAKPEDLPIPYLKDGLGSSDGANHLHDELKRMLDEKDGSIISDEELPTKIVQKGSLTSQTAIVKRVKPGHYAKVASLRKTLHRVLFSPGVHFIRDPRTGVQNFGTKLEDIPTPSEFAFHRCPTYVTPSKDKSLAELAEKEGCQFIGSTSSLTQALSQIYFALSGGKGVNLSTISMDFQNDRKDFTAGASLPANLILRSPAAGSTVYAVDSDKSHDVENVLSDYGRVLEKLLTAEDTDFKRFLKSAPESAVSKRERDEREAYAYCKTGSMLMRSQLDCRDPRLPGSGVFDIKTRAVHPIRHDRANHEANSVYDIATDRGKGPTFERELYDLTRSGMLKYSMQARIGGMDGVFCAYHNTKRLLGFQYLPLSEMDEKLFGSEGVGDLSFKYCVALLEIALKYITTQIAGQDIQIIIRHTSDRENSVDIAFHPTSDSSKRQGVRMNLSNVINGEASAGEIQFESFPYIWQQWELNYTLNPLEVDSVDHIISSAKKLLGSMATLSVPEGKTVDEMTAETAKSSLLASTSPSTQSRLMDSEPSPDAPKLLWRNPPRYIKDIREDAKRNGKAYEARKSLWWKGVAHQGVRGERRSRVGK